MALETLDRSEVLAVVLNWNGFAQTIRCVESLLSNSGVCADFLIVDNASADASVATLSRRFGAQRVLALRDNRGYAGGMNAGLDWWRANTRIEHALLMTQDVVLAPDAVRRMLDAICWTRSTVVGPVIFHRSDPTRVFSAGGILDRRRAQAMHLDEVRTSQPYRVDWLDGCCFLVSRRTVERIGGFDDRYFLYFEDTDFCERARQTGCSIVVAPDATVWQSTPEVRGQHYFYYMGRNRFLFWSDHFGTSFALPLTALCREVTWNGLGSVKCFLTPRRWSMARVQFQIFSRSCIGAILGVIDHLRGRYGWQRFPIKAQPAGTAFPSRNQSPGMPEGGG